MILFISNSWSCFFAKSLLYPHLKARYFSFSFYFSHTEIKRLRVDIQFISWNESQTQVIHALNISLHILKDSTFFGAQLLVLLSQTCFFLLLSGRYGYDSKCWFQAKMIINIRNELLSSCLGSLHQKLNW